MIKSMKLSDEVRRLEEDLDEVRNCYVSIKAMIKKCLKGDYLMERCSFCDGTGVGILGRICGSCYGYGFVFVKINNRGNDVIILDYKGDVK